MVKIRTEGREYVFWWGRGYGQQTSMLLSPRLSHRSPKDLTGPQNLMLSIFFFSSWALCRSRAYWRVLVDGM